MRLCLLLFPWPAIGCRGVVESWPPLTVPTSHRQVGMLSASCDVLVYPCVHRLRGHRAVRQTIVNRDGTCWAEVTWIHAHVISLRKLHARSLSSARFFYSSNRRIKTIFKKTNIDNRTWRIMLLVRTISNPRTKNCVENVGNGARGDFYKWNFENLWNMWLSGDFESSRGICFCTIPMLFWSSAVPKPFKTVEMLPSCQIRQKMFWIV